MSVATITTKGQVTLPKDIRDRLHLETGEKIDFRIDESSGTVIMVPLNKTVDEVCGLLAARGKTSGSLSPVQMDQAIAARLRRKHR